MDYIYHILVIACVYSILTISLNFVVGVTGILSLAHAAFYGIGAYISVLLTMKYNVPFLGGLLAGGLFSSMIGAIIGLPFLRIRGDYLFMATLGFCEIVRSVFNNWTPVTGGAIGMVNIPTPFPISSTISFSLIYFLFALTLLSIMVVFSWRMEYSPFGRILKAIREDEDAVGAIGKNTIRYKIIAFAIGAFWAGIAGSLYAHFTTYIAPSNFTLTESILIFAMMVLGGTGRISGAIIGSVILVILPEILRFVGLPATIAAPARQLFYGFLLIITMITRPQGLVGKIAL